MDSVPILFIEEVLFQLEQPSHVKEIPRYPWTWGRVADRKVVKKKVTIVIYQEPNKESSFRLEPANAPIIVLEPAPPLENLEQFALETITIYNKRRFERADTRNRRYPLNQENFQLLQRHFRRGHPCDLSLFADFQGAPLVNQLCLAPSRVTKIFLNNETLPTDILTRSIERGTLRNLTCNATRLTQELFPVVFKFVASENFRSLIFSQLHGEVSNETFVEGLVDAFLSGPRRQLFHFFVNERYRNLFGRLKGKDMWKKVDFHCSPDESFILFSFK
uniref:Uncharacterized protein n=1 Tax=Steinernema glaseri TaxID=37863 RepID=A0A1I8A5Y8_9BILA